MKCYYCGSNLGRSSKCPSCGADIREYKRLVANSNVYYNLGLERAKVRDLTGAIDSLRRSLFFYKGNVEARNLLGLIYFEIGEVVQALSEWVISRSFQPVDNPAQEYLDQVQKDKSFLDRSNELIKQYNQALLYAKQGSSDLAILQLKKVCAQKPTLLKAQQLLGLLYLHTGDYEKAKAVLRQASKVDLNNTQTLLYLKEVNQILAETGRRRKKQNDAFAYQSGNETIIQPIISAKSTLAMIGSLIMGVLIGAVCVYFLVFPVIRSNVLSANTELARTADAQLAAKEALVQSYEEQIEELESDKDDLESSQTSSSETITQYSNLIQAYRAFRNEKTEDALTIYETLDASVFDENAKAIYDEMAETLNPLLLADYYSKAQEANENQDYDTSISYYEKMMALDETYLDGQLLYEAAEAYDRKGDQTNALECYRKVVSEFPKNTNAATAKERIEELEDQE